MSGVASTLTGLKDIYYAKLTADNAPEGTTAGSATYGTPKKLGHAISVDMNPTVETATLYGDNMAVATKTKLKEITITIDTTDIPLEDRAIILGHTYDSTTGGVSVKGDDAPPYVAIMFEATTADDKSHFYKFYKGKFAPNQQTIETEGESINWQIPSMEGTFIARASDGKVYDMLDGAVAGSSSLASSWFTSV